MKRNIMSGIGMFLAAMLLVSMAFIPAVSAEALSQGTSPEIVNTEQPELIPEPLPTVGSASTIEQNPFWYLIEANKEEQKTLLKYIDNSYVSNKEKQEMKKAMKDIWKRYPDQITENDNIVLERVAKATAEYLNDVYGKKDVEVAWSPDKVHDNITRISVTKWGVSSYYAGIAGLASLLPDDWDSGFWQSWHHYYNPYFGTGNAPTNANYYAGIARTNYISGSYNTAYTNLGYSSHYLSDVGNPLHTGMEQEQIENQWVHYNYESYVSGNWTSGYNFKSIVDNNNNYYVITDPKQSTKDLATFSNSDLSNLYYLIYFHPDTWQTMDDVKTITERVLLKTAKYNLGLVKYMRS
ncbi:MAG: hypothetical protein SCH70_11880 [Candidatus Methanoperedens sp.]|nr:hypothetical protein [Candidatus Methanoperedens sp.]